MSSPLSLSIYLLVCGVTAYSGVDYTYSLLALEVFVLPDKYRPRASTSRTITAGAFTIHRDGRVLISADVANAVFRYLLIMPSIPVR